MQPESRDKLVKLITRVLLLGGVLLWVVGSLTHSADRETSLRSGWILFFVSLSTAMAVEVYVQRSKTSPYFLARYLLLSAYLLLYFPHLHASGRPAWLKDYREVIFLLGAAAFLVSMVLEDRRKSLPST